MQQPAASSLFTGLPGRHGLALAACGLLVASLSPATQATPVGPVYPPPGGVHLQTSGTSAGAAGGFNFIFSGFDASAFSALYWGPARAGAVSAGLDGRTHGFSFRGFAGNQARWSSDAPLFDGFGNAHSAQFFLTILTPGVAFIDPTTVGLSSALGALVDDSAGLDFTANLRFEAFDGAWKPLDAIQQPPGGIAWTVSEFQGGFFAVPEPGSLALVLAALLGAHGLGGARRRPALPSAA